MKQRSRFYPRVHVGTRVGQAGGVLLTRDRPGQWSGHRVIDVADAVAQAVGGGRGLPGRRRGAARRAGRVRIGGVLTGQRLHRRRSSAASGSIRCSRSSTTAPAGPGSRWG